ncbi:ABC transporter substrate binding protein [Aquabacterium humicola]|uniref:ABC transporter substrate binding protein n=1 Tax=Aquabacterium humicola TaxID=3237377 RepID=UPI0025429183|nr:ABC transporter substrate binding protein [Rubrivivax pictus]
MTMKAPIRQRRLLIATLLAAPAAAALAQGADAQSLAVVYPDIGEPYRSVFTKILEGIEQQARGRVASFAVGPAGLPADAQSELRKREVRAVIALGRNGLKAVGALDRSVSVIAGGVLAVPESEARDFAVHSLTPDPSLLFARLRSLVPSARRVAVVYDPRQNAWLIRMARDAAKAHGLELMAHEADDLKAALRIYQTLVASFDAKRDVLWLPHDSATVDDAAVLPLVLQEAWDRNFAVLSSSVAHVRRGALFSLYPDNLALGRRLGGAAMAAAGGHRSPGVLPLKDVRIAVNVRAASHLGLNLSNAQQAFDMVFPEQ